MENDWIKFYDSIIQDMSPPGLSGSELMTTGSLPVLHLGHVKEKAFTQQLMKHQQDLSLSFTKGNSLLAQADNVYSAVQTAFKQIKDLKI